MGFFCLRRRGIYFAMLTLAFAQMLYFIAFHAADLTGGDDGLRGIPLHPLGLFGMSLSLRTPLAFYFFAYALVVLAVAALKRILIPRSARCCRRSARTAIGPWPAATTSTGSSCSRSSSPRCSPGSPARSTRCGSRSCRSTRLYWTTSGQVVIMTLLGGAGTFFGPFVGAATFLILADRLSLVIEAWPLVIGIVFMAFVLFLPRGIWGTLTARGVER